MDVLRLGPLEVPPLAIGAMFWGTRVPVAVAHDLLDRAVERGARFVDTANNYAFWQPGAVGDESETCLGEWIARRGRDRIVLATKVGARPARPGAGTADALGLGRQAIFDQVTDSLRRLRTDHVDLLYAHVDDTRVPLAETVGALQDEVRRGRARTIGCSNITAPRFAEALRAAGQGPAYAVVQQRFSYLTPVPGTDLYPHVLLDDDLASVAAAAGATLTGYSSVLSGAYTRPDRPLPDGYRHGGTARQLAALAAAADVTGLDAGQVVLAWMTSRARPVLPVVGVSSPDQLASAVRAVSTRLPADVVAALDEARTVGP
jgi:aryl-alcohol dehydrogenase-like predicted oxidoreductase